MCPWQTPHYPPPFLCAPREEEGVEGLGGWVVDEGQMAEIGAALGEDVDVFAMGQSHAG